MTRYKLALFMKLSVSFCSLLSQLPGPNTAYNHWYANMGYKRCNAKVAWKLTGNAMQCNARVLYGLNKCSY